MLKLLMRHFYCNIIYTDEPELFYKVYKWNCGLYTLISLRKIIGIYICYLLGIVLIIPPITRMYGLALICISLFIFLLQGMEFRKQTRLMLYGIRTPAQIRTLYIQDFIRKYISINGRALGKKEWKAIKKYDKGLYNDLLCDECDHLCYFYSLEIAKIIKDSILIWGAIDDPFAEKHEYYAHAIILRNGYIYDSSMRQSERYEDFKKLYNFIKYKEWGYNDYSQKNFRQNEREEFREWCKKNNVLSYEGF